MWSPVGRERMGSQGSEPDIFTKMSFDVLLMRFTGGEPARVDAARLGAAVRDFAGSLVEHHGLHLADASDGGAAEISGLDGKDTGGVSFFVRCMSDQLANLIWSCALEAEMIVLPVANPVRCILWSEEQLRHVPGPIRAQAAVIIVSSSDEFNEIMRAGFAAWARMDRGHIQAI